MDSDRFLGKWLHCVAVAILLVFSISHYVDLAIGAFSHELDNTVFPFLTNRTVYFVAATLELFLAGACFCFRGQKLANLLILTFVAVLSWYRWAYTLTGGYNCGCSGFIGKAFLLSSAQEKGAAIVALVVLASTTLPWLLHSARHMALSFRAPLGLALLLFCPLVAPASTLEIRGEYNSSRYNPETGKPYIETQRKIAFKVLILGSTKYDILATNLSTGRWGRLVFDGTNTYELTPYDGVFVAKRPESNLVYSAISPSALYLRSVDEGLDMFVPWLTFGLFPDAAKTNLQGIVQIPLPWAITRLNPGAWGYKWDLKFFAGTRFLDNCLVIRDHSLDLADELELERFEIISPGSVSDKNIYRESLRTRKSRPHGYVNAKYQCVHWLNTNGVSIPGKSELKRYLHPSHSRPFYQAHLNVDSVEFRNDAAEPITPPLAPVIARDFRYAGTNKNGKVDFAEYEMQPGEMWKSDNNPELLAKAVQASGKSGAFSKAPRKNILAWLGLAVIILIPITVMLWGSRGAKRET